MENSKEQEYVLAYGNRRFEACKKLGWTKIQAYIQEEGITKDIDMSDIHLIGNTRININEEEINTLMQSIKQHGLLEPVGVWKSDSINEEKLTILNLVENEHRVNPSPLEFSRGCRILMKMGLNAGQIATRLSTNKSRVKSALQLSAGPLKDHLGETSFIGTPNLKNGKLPFSVLNRISVLRVANKVQERLIEVSKEEELTIRDIDTIAKLLSAGMDVEKAIKSKREFKTITPTIIVRKKALEKIGNSVKIIAPLINNMLQGKVPLEPDMIFYKKDFKDFKKGA